MPYEYRKLNPQEREEVLRERRERGFPWHSPPHPFRLKGHYLVTAATFEHAPLLADAARRTAFEDRLLKSMAGIGADILGWVILPNHYHVLLGVSSLEDVSHAAQRLHGSTAREWNLEDGETGRRRVWYKFADRMIRNEAHLYRALNYVHANPVKHGYAAKANEWIWSSLQSYLDAEGRDWLVDIWRKYKPGDEFGRGWDD